MKKYLHDLKYYDIYHLYTFLNQDEFREIWLTEEEIALIDPTGLGRVHLLSMRDLPGNDVPKPFSKYSSTMWLDRYIKLLSKINFSAASNPYLEYNHEMLSKYGPQGRKRDVSKIKESFSPFYENATHKRSFKRMQDGVYYLKRKLKALVQKYGLPPYEQTIHGTDGTCGALPTMAKKGQFATETIGKEFIQVPLADLPGQRDMRGKPRTINMDATMNVRYIENEILHIQTWLKTYLPDLFGSWRNPAEYLQPQIYSGLLKKYTWVMFDYEKCDEHFSWEAAREIVLPVIEELVTPRTYQKLYRFIYMLFRQPIYWGDSIYVGLHNLLSGQIITNFLETIFGVVLLISGQIEFRIPHHKFCLSVCGDDLHVGIAQSHAHLAEDFSKWVVSVSNEADMIMNYEKCQIAKTLTYLRRVYYIGQPVLYNHEGQPYVPGAYPSVLTLNQCINPEYYMPSESVDWFKALFSRLDNMWGSPEFVPVCELLLKEVSTAPSPDELNQSCYTDWWFRLYGENWNPLTSPSYAVAKRMGLVRA
jgi:hypothetical protein